MQVKPLLFISTILLSLPLLSIAANNDRAEQTSELENLRNKIRDVETLIKGAKDETDRLRKELRDNEINTAETLNRLYDIQLSVNDKNTELQDLKFEQLEHQQSLQLEKQKLVQQIRSAYRVGRNDYVKLILNQQDPSRVGRTLAYYDYHNRVRAERIKQVKHTLSGIKMIKQSIEAETRQLKTFKTEHEAKLSEFHRYRASRQDIISRLQSYIEEQDVELQTLQENERKLGELLSGLEKEEVVTAEMFENMPPFHTLRGNLKWPVKGKMLRRFGASKKGGNLKWRGVLIDAESGTSVNAISTGMVVFADWFRNLGLLIIIDHGGGYMSLYGHNQNLLKNTGDWVLAGETIANIGDSGGRSDTALYFEIRKGTEPLNPSRWCRG